MVHPSGIVYPSKLYAGARESARGQGRASAAAEQVRRGVEVAEQRVAGAVLRLLEGKIHRVGPDFGWGQLRDSVIGISSQTAAPT